MYKKGFIFIGLVSALFLCFGCQTPYHGTLGPEDFNGWIESETDEFICLWNGFDRICVLAIPGPPGKDGIDGRDGTDGRDGRNGRDGQTFIAIHERRIEVIVEKIINTVVVEEYRVEVPVETVVERVVTEFVDREVPITVFVDRTVEVIKEVIKEVPVEVIKEVPVETIVKEIKTVYVEVPVETIVKEVETVYVEVPAQATEISVTEGAVYTEDGYNNPPDRYHRHTFTHMHNGARHTHRFAHPDGEIDDWEADVNRSHDGFAGLQHDRD